MPQDVPPGPCKLPLPRDPRERLLMLAVRRTATLGLRDAAAALMMLQLYGANFRRPLVLLRAFVLELSLAAQGPIRFARCCSPSMTVDESEILKVLTEVDGRPELARNALFNLTGSVYVAEALAAARVFSRSTQERVRQSAS